MKTLPNALAWTASLLAIVSQTVAAALPDLRILPLGDSITKGSLSSDGNGYRNYLETKLQNYEPDSFTTVDMIGTIHTDGSMKDKDHEGHSGEYVKNIVTYWQKPFGAGPNVVLLHVGTNNMDLNRNVAEAPGLYSTMLDEMYKKLPNAFIIVCKVIHSKNAELNARASDFNAKLEEMVKQRRAAGRPIAIIDMGLVDSDIKDEKHPTDLGYAKMANGWYKAIVDGNMAGLIKSHGTSDPGGVGVGVGSGGDNGASTGSAGYKGSIKGGADDFAYDKLILADLDGDGFDDYILADNDGKVRAWKINNGGMTSLGYIQPDWADLDITRDSMTNLVGLIANGAYLDPKVDGAIEMRQQIEKPLYAIMIPATWDYNSNPAQGEKAVFVLSTDYECTNDDECPDRPPGYPNGLEMFMTSDAAQKTCYCHGGKWFFLLQVLGHPHVCGLPGSGGNCDGFNRLVAPKGLDAFDGKEWSGLTKHQFVQGSINTWEANGHKNGYQIDFDDPDAVGIFTGDSSIGSPGVIPIPVCGLSEVYDNWENPKDAKHFPCN
ncbi:hypothetical protein VE02_05238 [Pseudogymnoascus sp. 03VT05]|nr:hypothetical protein VE02_05238 [Pseudogymnoascus sp. 03VT05]